MHFLGPGTIIGNRTNLFNDHFQHIGRKKAASARSYLYRNSGKFLCTSSTSVQASRRLLLLRRRRLVSLPVIGFEHIMQLLDLDQPFTSVVIRIGEHGRCETEIRRISQRRSIHLRSQWQRLVQIGYGMRRNNIGIRLRAEFAIESD